MLTARGMQNWYLPRVVLALALPGLCSVEISKSGILTGYCTLSTGTRTEAARYSYSPEKRRERRCYRTLGTMGDRQTIIHRNAHKRITVPAKKVQKRQWNKNVVGSNRVIAPFRHA